MDLKAAALQLAAPFPASEVRWKPQSVSGNRALAAAYIDAKTVMDRLDAVLGLNGWFDEYSVLPCGSVVCTLYVYVSDKGSNVGRQDVGTGKDVKAAFSDALKRAAVKFGVGRYLKRIKPQWCEYDPHKKQLSKTPVLPAWALPPVVPGKEPLPATSPPGSPVSRAASSGEGPADGKISEAQAKELGELRKAHGVDWARFCEVYQLRRSEDLPAVHFEAAKRQCLNADSAVRATIQPSQVAGWSARWDAWMTAQGWIRAGELQEYLRRAAAAVGEKSEDFALWPPKMMLHVEQAVQQFVAQQRQASMQKAS